MLLKHHCQHKASKQVAGLEKPLTKRKLGLTYGTGDVPAYFLRLPDKRNTRNVMISKPQDPYIR